MRGLLVAIVAIFAGYMEIRWFERDELRRWWVPWDWS